MKSFGKILAVIFIFLGFHQTICAQVGINQDNPSDSAVLHISSDSKGVLFPAPVEDKIRNNKKDGLFYYSYKDKRFYYFNGNNWQCINPLSATDSNKIKATGNLNVNSDLTVSNKLVVESTTGSNEIIKVDQSEIELNKGLDVNDTMAVKNKVTVEKGKLSVDEGDVEVKNEEDNSSPEKRTKESKVNTKRIIEVVQKIRELNGIAILAHVNSDNGYRKEMKNCGLEDHEVKQKIDELSIDGIEINKPEDAKHFEFEGKKYPCVIGSDAHYIHEIGGKEHITRIKMTTSSFNDLQKALLDPETRIRYQDQQSSYIKKVLGIKFEGGFLDEQTIPFSSNLNCLIGPRGSGKSTCIEAIRYIFDKHVPEDRTKDINRLRSNVFPDCCVFHGRWPPSPCDGGQ